VVFLQNSLRNPAGNLRAEFDPEQGIRIPEQGIWRPPGNPNPARLCWAPCPFGWGSGCVAGIFSPCGERYMNDHRSCQSRNRRNQHSFPASATKPRPSPPGRTRASSSMTAQTGLVLLRPTGFYSAVDTPSGSSKKMLNTRYLPTISLLGGTLNRWNRQPVSPKITRQERSPRQSGG
jgi:hypothetical protein